MPKYSERGSYYYELQEYLDEIADNSEFGFLTEYEESDYIRLFWQEHSL